MNRILAVVAVSLILAGCAAMPPPQAEAPPKPSPSVNAAESTCTDFSDLTKRISELVVKVWTEDDVQPGDEAELEGAGAQFDSMALQAEDVIGERIGAVAEILLTTSPIVMSLDPDEYFAALEAVQRACAAEDVEIGIGTWS